MNPGVTQPSVSAAPTRRALAAATGLLLAVSLLLAQLDLAQTWLGPAVAVTVLGVLGYAWWRASAGGLDFEAMAKLTRNAVFVTDEATRLLWVNPAFTRITGYSPSDARGQTLRSLLAPGGDQAEQVPRALVQVHEAMAARQPFSERLLTRCRDGRLFTARYDGQTLSRHRWLWVAVDVDAQELSRRRLESRARILEAMSSPHNLSEFLAEVVATLSQSLPDLVTMVVTIDRQTLQTSAVSAPFDDPCTAFLRGRALAPDAPTCLLPALSGKLERASDLANDPRWQPCVATLTARGLTSCWSLPAFNPRREVVACLTAFSRTSREPTPDELALMTDATDLLGLALEKRAVERENRTLRCAMESADDAVLVIGEGRIQFQNEVFGRTFSAGRLVGTPFSEFAKRHLEDGTEPLVAAVNNCSSWHGRIASRPARPREPVEWYEVSATPVIDRDSQYDGVLVTLRDITPMVYDERMQLLSVEGEKAKAAVAWAMSVDAPLAERCSAAMASVFQMQGLDTECRGALYLREGAEFQLFSHCGEGGDAPLTQAVLPGQGQVGEVALTGRLLTTMGCLHEPGCTEPRHCDTARAHGHYVVPLLERPDYPLGLLVLWSTPSPIRDSPRLEALSMIAELMATAVLRDRAERSLITSSRQADAANRAKSDFLATMSHEIRTPMNGVLGFTQLLLESELSEDQRDNAQLIFNSAEALLALLNDILDFSKIEAGKLVIDPRPTAIVEATREAVGLLKTAAERKAIGLRFTADPLVPVGLLVDAMRYRQVLLNLIGNAIKFTPSGTVDISLTVEPDATGRLLHVQVKDSGIGIAPEVMPNLFGKFVQADASTSRRFGGTGLGLAISKRLVELMGGTIGAYSQEGVGSTFWFKVPITEAIVEGARRGPGAHSNAMAAPHRRVLLAEDNLVNQTLARKVLEKMNAEVALAVNGLEAVRLAQAHHYDVILMDCQMPELDGFEATRAIRTWEASQPGRPHVPIIAVTANAFADDIERCLASGMDAVLTKPFKFKDLERTLDQFDQPQLGLVGG
jgi:PAS domain S-box-containing protein